MIIKTPLVKIITFGFANGITLYPFVLFRKETKLSGRLLNHEKIHLKQQVEMLVIFFYLWYVLEFLVRFAQYLQFTKAYYNISFEREAYCHESNKNYLEKRKWFAWINFL